jgi:hypothetical protein
MLLVDVLGIPTSGHVAIKNHTSGSMESRVISPTGIPSDVQEQPNNDLSHALFNNDASDNIPSQHMCPITQEPFFDAVHFNVPTTNGTTIVNQQVYERLVLYRYIATHQVP